MHLVTFALFCISSFSELEFKLLYLPFFVHLILLACGILRDEWLLEGVLLLVRLLAGEHAPLVPPELGAPVLEPHLRHTQNALQAIKSTNITIHFTPSHTPTFAVLEGWGGGGGKGGWPASV